MRRANPAAIGAFVVGAAAILVFALVVIGSGRFFRRTVTLVSYFRGSVNGLKVGAPVKFKGVEIGSVTDVRLRIGSMASMTSTEFRIPVVYEIDVDRTAERGARTLDAEGADELIQQGLRAQLSPESFLTGLLYVSLDVRPETPIDLVKDPGVDYPEIPTLPTALEEIQMRTSQIVAQLEDADIRGLVASARDAVDGVRDIVRSPALRAAVDRLDGTIVNLDQTLVSVRGVADGIRGEGRLGERLERAADRAAAALEEATAAMRDLRGTVQPDSLFAQQLRTTLADVSDAAGAVRRLADALERDPSALVRGRAVAEER